MTGLRFSRSEPGAASNGGPLATERLKGLFPLILILAVACGLYANTLDNELTWWDDNRYVTGNERIRDISPSGVADIFNPYDIIGDPELEMPEYLPVTTLVHAVVYRFSGLDPAGYHLANLLFYLMDLSLLYLLVSMLTRDGTVAFLASLLYAVMPVHVESVTWVSATKDVVSMAFLLASYIFYIKYSRAQGRGLAWYALSLAVFTAGMLSNTLLVTLPALLVVHDLCVDKRLRILDKAPYLVIGAMVSYIYVKVNTEFADAVYLTSTLSGWELFLTDLTVMRDYLAMLFVPLGLNVYYYYLPSDIPDSILEPGVLLSAVLVAGVLAAAIISHIKDRKLVTFCILWFFISLLPLVNIMPSSTIKADRYLFIPSVGFAILAGWGVVRLRALNPGLRRAVPAVFIAWLVFLSVLTFQRNLVWENGITLWSDSLAKDPRSARAHFNLGNEYRHRGMLDKAIEEYGASLRLNPSDLKTCNHLGAALGVKGRYLDAVRVLEQCLGLDPRNTSTKLNLARGYLAIGRPAMAETQLKELLSKEPTNTEALDLLSHIEGR